jgi:predicted phage terminase large subunit-like protein
MVANRRDAEVEYLLRRELARRKCSKSMIDFACHVMPDYQVNWHHKRIADAVQDVVTGKTKKLAVMVPPQHGKSQLVSRTLPAWALGVNPALRIAGCSYNLDFARRFNRDVQRIVDTLEYREIFPNVRLNDASARTAVGGNVVRNTDQFEIVGNRGSYTAAGIGTALTGLPVDLGVIDDPVKDRSEAESETYRERVWEWYTDVFCTRLHNDSRQIICMTRWHDDDLLGRILKRWDDWTVLSIPALRDDMTDAADPREIGQPIWPERHSAEKMIELRERAPYSFAALYQQSPSLKGGNIFKVSGVQRYDQAPERGRVILSVDANFKEGSGHDNVSIDAWGYASPNFYLLDHIAKPFSFQDSLAVIRQFAARHKPSAILVEDKANGSAIMSVLRENLSGIVPILPKESKIARAESVADKINAGNVQIPRFASWADEWIAELASFPNGKHDDRVDSMTQAIHYLTRSNAGGWA